MFLNRSTLKILFLIFFFQVKVQALLPLDSLILGDLSKYYDERPSVLDQLLGTRPSELVMRGDGKRKGHEERRRLALYRGYILEGQNLAQSCQRRSKIEYAVSWDEQQVKRSILSTLQYLGLEATVNSIPKYAKYFDFSKEEYGNLVENLVGNYCSNNLSVIGHRALRKNLIYLFNSDNKFELPEYKKESLFPKKLMSLNNQDEIKKQEFAWTIELFKSFCSWGGDTENIRLLAPLVRNPVTMAFVFRHLTGVRLNWNSLQNNIEREERPKKTVQVFCRNLICRKTDFNTFNVRTPRALGSFSLYGDFEGLYCQSFRDENYKYRNQVPKLLKMMKKYSFDDQNLLVSQFISLTTGVPDLFVRMKTFDEGKEFIRSSVDNVWDHWAKRENSRLDKDLYYEEPITVELVERSLYYNNRDAIFSAEFDINLGEFDRSSKIIGKLKSVFKVKLSKKLLAWGRREWILTDPEDKPKVDKILKSFRIILNDDFKEARKSLDIPPWKGDLLGLFIREILEQLALYDGAFFANENKGMVEIPIKLNFGMFALRHIRYQHLVRLNEGDRKKKIQRLRALRY
jgi:hypothetical protein